MLPPLVSKPTRKLLRAGNQLEDDSPFERFHRVRILAKRARYASEAVAPALGNGERQRALRFADRAADIQDTLGELQDSRVAHQLIGDFVTSKSKDGPTCFAAGRLDERQQQRAQRTFKRFPKQWRRLRRAAWPES